MRLSIACSILPIVASVGALTVTEPKKFAEVDPSNSFEVKWTSVQTDTSHCDIYLVNNAVYPNVEKKLASDIDTSDGSYTVDGISGLSTGGGYQINLVSNEEHDQGILAQSPQFNVTAGASSSSSTKSHTSTSTHKSTTKSSTTTSTGTSSAEASTSTSPSTRTKATGSSTATSASGASISATDAAESDSPNAAGSLASPMLTVAGVMAGVLAWAL